jgi:Flp pilus assembly protein TadB
VTLYLLLAGAGLGLGLTFLLRGAFPPAPTLAEALDALSAPPVRVPILDADQGGWASRLGAPMAGWLAAANLPGAKIARDLAVLERATRRHLADKAVLALAGFVFVPLAWAVPALFGLRLPWALPLWGSLAGSIVGFYLPDLSVKAEAKARRAQFRHALTCFLDLVVISLSGGAGVEEALTQAASTGEGWAFSALRRALTASRLSRVPPWTTLGQLGDELEIAALKELSASLSLAGTEGAKVRASLSSRAQALRAQALADQDAASQQATERMSLPVIGMFGGFLLFIAFPALSHIMTAL